MFLINRLCISFITYASLLLLFVESSHGQYVALILARGGSKQIPKKNLMLVESKSLLKRTIETAKNAKVFDEVWVSTDDLEIYAEAVSAGAKVFARSEKTSSDVASSFIAVLEFYSFFPNFTTIALLQCTSPFQSSIFLRRAHFMMSEVGYDSVFSVSKNHKLLWEKNELGSIIPLNFNAKSRPRRQDMEGQWIENGMFYWFRSWLIEKGLLQGGKIGVVEIAPERSLEIDTFHDLEYARYIAPKLLPLMEWEVLTCSRDDY